MKYRTHRYPTEFPATVKTPTGIIDARIKDVNATGALLITKTPLSVGQSVTFTALGHKMSGVVQWAAPDKCGIKFKPFLTVLQIDILRYKKAGRSLAGHRHSSTGFQEMT